MMERAATLERLVNNAITSYTSRELTREARGAVRDAHRVCTMCGGRGRFESWSLVLSSRDPHLVVYMDCSKDKDHPIAPTSVAI